MAKGFLLQINN